MLQLTDRSRIIDACHLALADMADAAASANQQALQEDRYPWLRVTHRRNGETVSSPRNAEDLSQLVGSQQLEQTAPGLFALSWGGAEAPHAAIVFHGATLKNGTHLPARKWIYEALRGDNSAPSEWRNPKAVLNVPLYFAERFRKYAAI